MSIVRAVTRPRAVVVVLILTVASLAVGAVGTHAITVKKRCGSIKDPLKPSVTIFVNITVGKPIACKTARRVLRTYLRRVPRPRRSTAENVFDIRVDGRAWGCSVTREVDAGRQTAFACSRTKAYYTNIDAGP